jgi:hypothetical protein
VATGAGAEGDLGSTTVRGAGVAAGLLRWIVIVRCLMIGLVWVGAAALADVAEVTGVPRPQLKVTAAIPATNELTSPPAVTIAAFLFTVASLGI